MVDWHLELLSSCRSAADDGNDDDEKANETDKGENKSSRYL